MLNAEIVSHGKCFNCFIWQLLELPHETTVGNRNASESLILYACSNIGSGRRNESDKRPAAPRLLHKSNNNCWTRAGLLDQ